MFGVTGISQVSQSGVTTDPDLKELRKPWADPFCKENIMVNVPLLIYQPI
jgi:hypothetical protein